MSRHRTDLFFNLAGDTVKRPLTKNEISGLRDLVDRVIYASSKAAGADAVRRLEFSASHRQIHIEPYFSGKLSEVISYAEAACGQPKNKEHWMGCVEQCWYVFKNGVGPEE